MNQMIIQVDKFRCNICGKYVGQRYKGRPYYKNGCIRMSQGIGKPTVIVCSKKCFKKQIEENGDE